MHPAQCSRIGADERKATEITSITAATVRLDALWDGVRQPSARPVLARVHSATVPLWWLFQPFWRVRFAPAIEPPQSQNLTAGETEERERGKYFRQDLLDSPPKKLDCLVKPGRDSNVLRGRLVQLFAVHRSCGGSWCVPPFSLYLAAVDSRCSFLPDYSYLTETSSAEGRL
jgi:hypothetical protein